MDYLALINDNLYDIEDEDGNEQEDWMLVSGLDKKFGKDWYEYRRSASTKRFLVDLEKYRGIAGIYSEGSGRGAKTYLHPLMVIHYAAWLNPEFHIVVLEVFKRYLEGDKTLAEEVIERNIEITGTTKDAEWLKARLEGKIQHKSLKDFVKSRGGKACYQRMNGDTNRFILGASAKEIQRQRGVKNTRDGLTQEELLNVAFTEQLSRKRIEQVEAFGDKELSYQHNRTCRDVAALLDN